MNAKLANKKVTCKQHEYGQWYMSAEIEKIPNLISHKLIEHRKQVWACKCKKCGKERKMPKAVYDRYMAAC